MEPDVWRLYRLMLRSRLFERAVSDLWNAGLISGEMHLGLGEEGIVAGVLDHIVDGDALALDHRGTPPLIMRGVEPVALLNEFLGHPAGLCGGKGGHMHLFAPEFLAASSGIVGSSGPAAIGFALAGRMLRPGSLAVAFFGEGAMNQGMLLESLNLAAAWQLPVVFVCKDNGQAIFTDSASQTGGNLLERARGFGMPALAADGHDVVAVWQIAREVVERARAGGGPSFLLASCTHLEAHLLGDAALRLARHPIREGRSLAASLIKALSSRRGAPIRQRLEGALTAVRTGRAVRRQATTRDPVAEVRVKLASDATRLADLERAVKREIGEVMSEAQTGIVGGSR